MGFSFYCGFGVGVCVGVCVVVVEVVVLCWLLLFADQVRVRVLFGRVEIFLTAFLVFLCWALVLFPVGDVLVAGVVAGVVSAWVDDVPWFKGVVNGLSFGLGVVAACGVVAGLGAGVASVILAGMVFEFVNMLVLSVGFRIFEGMRFRESLFEWWSGSALFVWSGVVGVVLAGVWLNFSWLWPGVFAFLILSLHPKYSVFSGGSLLRGSWHTEFGISESRPRLSVLRSHF